MEQVRRTLVAEWQDRLTSLPVNEGELTEELQRLLTQLAATPGEARPDIAATTVDMRPARPDTAGCINPAEI